nr:hypothetical protein [Tanacetum cinerariifolium]
MRRSYEDLQPLPRIFTKVIFTHGEPGALYRHHQLKANQTPIRMENLMNGDNHRSDQREYIIIQSKESRRILIKLEAPATTSKPKEVQAHTPEDNMYRANRKGFLEDDDSSDDSISIMLERPACDKSLQNCRLNCSNEARILEEEPLNKVKRSNKPKRSKQKSWEKWSTLGEPSGKLDYYYDWDDDERNGGKILVLQEQYLENQQDFPDEYLPQWDDQPAIQKQELEMEWANPFAAKCGEEHTSLHLSKNE